MKKLLAFACLVLLGSLAFCDKDEVREVTITVASEMGTVHDGESGMDLPTLVGKIGASDRWESIGAIEGFVFEAGYECRLLAAVIEVREPAMGASSIRYKMLQLLSKEKKDSEGL